MRSAELQADLSLFGTAFEVDGKRVPPYRVKVHYPLEPAEAREPPKDVDWKQWLADESSKVIHDDIVESTIEEQMRNMRSTSGLVRYGFYKVAAVAAQIAYAQALGIDPVTLRLTREEAYEQMVKLIDRDAALKAVIVVPDPKEQE